MNTRSENANGTRADQLTTGILKAAVCFAVATAFVLGSCAVEPYYYPYPHRAGDDSRMDAVEIPLNRTVIDNVNAEDPVDWKYFEITESGTLTILVAFDSQEAAGFMRLFDANPAPLGELVDEREVSYRLVLDVTEGFYHLEFGAHGNTDYTVEVSLEPERSK